MNSGFIAKLVAAHRRGAAAGLVLLLAGVLSGCFPLPWPARVFQYSIDVSVGTKHYLVTQYVSCQQFVVLSMGPNGWHHEWFPEGQVPAAFDVGNDLVLIYVPSVSCGGKETQELPKVAAVLKNPNHPELLCEIDGAIIGPAITINRVWVTRVQHYKGKVGPSAEQQALAKLIVEQQHGFHRVAVKAVPFQVWSGTDRARDYFSRFDSIRVAEAGDAGEQASPSQGIHFPFWREREEAELLFPQRVEGPVQLVADDGIFSMSPQTSTCKRLWYSNKADPSAPDRSLSGQPFIFEDATVQYKNLQFKVRTTRELYDPESRAIYDFTASLLSNPFLPPPPS